MTLRARLAAISTIVFGLLLAAFSIVSYQLLARQLDADVTERLTELTDGLHDGVRHPARGSTSITWPRGSLSMGR